jgi:hypothetical protein
MVEETVKRKNPFVGPRPFTRADILHGRERETDALFNLLISGRILLMYAPSGAGKTSLIQAALIPLMIEEGFQVLDNLRVNAEPEPAPEGAEAANRYLSSIFDSLEDARLGEDDGDGSERLSGAQLNELGLDGYLSRYHPESHSLLIFDQFEELLTLNPVDIEAKRAFFEEVGRALRNPMRWALFSMREDYRSALDPYLEPLPTRLKTTFRLDLLTRDVAIDVIRKTAGQADVDFQQPAAHRLVEDLSRVQVMQLDGTMKEQLGPFVEPVQLQVVCYDLFERLAPGDPDITEEEVKEIGDVDQALARYYAGKVQTIAKEADPDQVSPELAPQQTRRARKRKKAKTPAKVQLAEMVIRNWFDRELITAGGVRNQLLMGAGSSKGLDNQMIDRLENAHLVRKDNRGGRTWIELAHDRLVGPVRQDNEAWFRAETGGWKRRAAPWLFGGTLAVLLSYFLRGNVGWMAFLLMAGSSILLFTQSYVLTTQQTRQLAMEERRLQIYKGSRTLGVLVGTANVLILNAVIGLGVATVSEVGSRLTGPLLLLFVLIISGLDLMGIAAGYSGAKALSRFLVRLRVPYELGFFAGFVAISITISVLAGLFFLFLMILISY